MEEEIHEERGAVMRQKYFDLIERFSERMNQLLEEINRVSKFGLMKFVCHSFVLALYESTNGIITNAKNEHLMIFGNSICRFCLFYFIQK
jgi:uncharacterized FlaG/YvyC family protein